MRSLSIILCLAFLAFPCYAQDTSPTKVLPGVKVTKVPEVLYFQVPGLPAGKGVLVEQVGPDAAKQGLRRFDVVVSCAGMSVQEGDQFLRLMVSQSGAVKVPLVVFRGGKELTLNVSLSGLLISPAVTGPTAMLKPGGPPAVTVEAKPLEGKRMSVTFTFYSTGASKLERVTCQGSLEEIQQRVKDLAQQNRMPPRVRDLADVAIERLQVLNAPAKK
jgi:hypothetical protein